MAHNKKLKFFIGGPLYGCFRYVDDYCYIYTYIGHEYILTYVWCNARLFGVFRHESLSVKDVVRLLDNTTNYEMSLKITKEVCQND